MSRKNRADIKEGNLRKILPEMEEALSTIKEELLKCTDLPTIRFKQGRASILSEYIDLLKPTVSR